TQSLDLLLEDPDAPGGTYDHWIVWNIPPTTRIEEDSNPGISGSNSADRTGYRSPCPPDGSHRYFFSVYALDAELDLAPGATKAELKKIMKNHILAKGSVMAQYERECSDLN
ncbi:MAG: YbhB/YbcL family Raf kinase inhibitor-like protein, partial [Chitinophagaceae bacterium]